MILGSTKSSVGIEGRKGSCNRSEKSIGDRQDLIEKDWPGHAGHRLQNLQCARIETLRSD
jgi:hypothetical protein